MRLASLAWYDLKVLRWATDSLWAALAENCRAVGIPDVPLRLNRRIPYQKQWLSRHYLFGQACGYDVQIAHSTRLQLVATPAYSAAGCAGPLHCSFVIVRDDADHEALDDLRGCRCVINTPTSHSGMNVLRALVAPLHTSGRFFADVKHSGAHETSLQWILNGTADVAAIDCVTYALLAKHRPESLAGTRILCRTQQVPAPPFVTSVATSREVLRQLRRALAATMNDASLAEARAALLLDGVEYLPLAAYRPIAELDALAEQHGYDEIPGLLAAV